MIISDANYDIAWTNLNDRYNNDRELMFAIIRRLVSFPNMPQQSSSSLRTLIDTSKECRRSLAVLRIPLDKGLDAFFIFHIFSKLDQTTREHWEQSLKTSAIPELDELLEFLEQRARALAAGSTVRTSSRPPVGKEEPNRRTAHVHHTQTNNNCKVCSQSHHPLFKCQKFLAFTVPERFEVAKKSNLCFNCLAGGHSTNRCSSSGRCRQCQQRHHTLLHKVETNSTSSSQEAQALALHTSSSPLPQTLLATAVVRVNSSSNVELNCRALLDNGSTVSFITEDLCNKLKLRKSKINAEVTGLSSTSIGTARWSTTVSIRPHFQSSLEYNIPVIILPIITGMLPSNPFNNYGMTHLKGLTLADPTYHIPSRIDLLLGSDLFWDILLPRRQHGNPNQPSAYETTFGWLVAGKTTRQNSPSIQTFVSSADLNAQLQRFWELENCNNETLVLTQEENYCEEEFQSTHSRGQDGTFTVAIPWRNPRPSLGSTFDIALRRFHQLERRLEKESTHYSDYVSFMRAYEALGHMEEVPSDKYKTLPNPTSFIPHHFVLKLDSTTTKFRVVFDASCKSTNGISLNDTMAVGPVLQDTITDILTRFRCHRYAFSADIQKMYRQIRVQEADRDMHHILWREHPSQPLKQYRLLTVTYGTASAPYLATKCLQQLANTEKSTLPLASKVALTDFYVDDLLSGAATLEEAIALQDELLQLTQRGGFPLRKWSSNCPELLNRLPVDFLETRPPTTTTTDDYSLHLPSSDDNPKTLGLVWNVKKDSFQFKLQQPLDPKTKWTKRAVSSDIAKLFDPLGWVAPVIIQAKILMQTLWKLSIKWDDVIPQQQLEEWIQFKSNMSSITSIAVPRCMLPATPSHIGIAGFSDASEKAYAAVTYLCVYFLDRPPAITIISAKTRVAPVKQVSLPRLELCGAQLLSSLVNSNIKCLKISFNSVRCWTDSTIVLSWLASPPTRWKTFVANRVSEVQTNLPTAVWNHVPGDDNPADCASRGISPQELYTHNLWWSGPQFLLQDPFPCESTNHFSCDPEAASEEKTVSLHATNDAQQPFTLTLLDRFSSLPRLQRVTSWIRRVAVRCKTKSIPKGPLTVQELRQSLNVWIKIVQQEAFGAELQSLSSNKSLHQSSKLNSLNPFVDDNGLLRVGGRLRKASLPHNQKHPILLPSKSHLTVLVVNNAHYSHCHAGPQLVQTVLFQQFWILRGRDTIRNLIKRCVTCRRNAPILQQQMMADLPSARVTPTRPFLRCGVDYAGPFTLRPIPSRAKTTFKSYLALFVCLSTRAIHLEIVSSLSTECFIAALRRFSSRRGRPSDIYSDQGTNFVGADKELRKLLQQSIDQNAVTDHLSREGTQWHFNPPGAPHFGGLWEAGVKSVKFHLHRVTGSTILNLEEMTTVTTQIEAILNSRPLTAQSTDPSDYSVLTPGHFLVGAPLTAVPDPDLSHEKIGRLGRWQLLQKIQQDFWHRWSNEFLTRMQQRPKWHNMRKNVELNDLVILKDENLPPQRWKLGRVIELHPGTDTLVRVVTVRTAEGTYKRPVTKLCILPVHDHD